MSRLLFLGVATGNWNLRLEVGICVWPFIVGAICGPSGIGTLLPQLAPLLPHYFFELHNSSPIAPKGRPNAPGFMGQ